MIQKKRMGASILAGALLGVLCIIGVGSRLAGGYIANAVFLFGMWYNRVIMGILIGFAGEVNLLGEDDQNQFANAAVRGLIFGIIVSFAIFFSSELRDLPSLFAGFAYGPIIDIIATYLGKK
ncbi:MAG: hypothetical protein KGY80_10750 [Candidatus Thorarchaeota archaeon]|nr:hypothetical protein [Candidatus Thorarchaeota archaeon]